jgi:hypothetical protein
MYPFVVTQLCSSELDTSELVFCHDEVYGDEKLKLAVSEAALAGIEYSVGFMMPE